MSQQANAIPVNTQGHSGFAVAPIDNCPHVKDHVFQDVCLPKCKGIMSAPCADCGDKTENWFCLTCGQVFCSRYVKGHMAAHNKSSTHPIVLSLADLSFWCYNCEAYIIDDSLKKIHREVYFDKFKCYPEDYNEEQEDQAEQALVEQFKQQLSISVVAPPAPAFDKDLERKNSIQFLAQLIKSGKAKNIIVLTGAGLSTAAGIPDFRSPGTGLYDNLQKYNLPHPTAIFELGFFKQNPKPFFELCKDFFAVGKYKPTKCHHLIKLFEKNNLLLRNYTQNIDGLEHKAKIDASKLVEAHGTYETATCQVCRKKFKSDYIQSILSASDQVQVPKCDKKGCEGVIKPDIVFFGESLPVKFELALASDMPKCDLIIVIGTSLSVYPVAYLIEMVYSKCPRVLINRDRSGPFEKSTGPDAKQGERDWFIGGSIEDAAQELCDALGWKDDLEKLVEEAAKL